MAAPIHGADEGDTATLDPTLAAAEKNLAAVGLSPTPEDPCDLVADKGYHSRDVLKDLDDSPWKTRIAEPRPSKGYLRWHGDDEARAAVYVNRNRLRSGVGKEAMRKRGEVVERSFAHVLERGGMRRTWLRGRENVHKRYLVHVAGHNLGILMRALFGAGTPKETAVIRNAFLFVVQTAEAITVMIVAVFDAIGGADHRGRIGCRLPRAGDTDTLYILIAGIVKLPLILLGLGKTMRHHHWGRSSGTALTWIATRETKAA